MNKIATSEKTLVSPGGAPIKSKAKAKMKVLKVGDLVETPPNELHALKIGKNGNEFIVFTIGKRGGKDYEADTFRFQPTIIG